MIKTRRRVLATIARAVAVNPTFARAASAGKLVSALNASVISCVISEVLGYNAQEKFLADGKSQGGPVLYISGQPLARS